MAREAAWLASRAAEAAAKRLLATEGLVVPYPVVDRHPLYVMYYNILKAEFRHAINRAHARNRMKRFVSDVHTVWLTNLSALREHSFQVSRSLAPVWSVRSPALPNQPHWLPQR